MQLLEYLWFATSYYDILHEPRETLFVSLPGFNFISSENKNYIFEE